jgi:hypothetical protein
MVDEEDGRGESAMMRALLARAGATTSLRSSTHFKEEIHIEPSNIQGQCTFLFYIKFLISYIT